MPAADDRESGDAERTADGGDRAPEGDSDDDASGGDSDDDAPGRDPDVEDQGETESEFPANPDRAATLREVAEDVRGESSESEQLANVLYRTSDIYDPDEDTTPEEVMQNVKFILEVKERGGLGR
jgi:hypothetical protein